MNGRTLAAVALVAGLLSARSFADDVVEHVVVRNRLYSTQGKFELSPSVGFSLVDRLTTHTGFKVSAAYNLFETFGIEARVGYALSGHTTLADDVSQQFLNRTPALPMVDDLSNLWELKGSVLLGVRWMPIYGKISLLAEVPVHFQAYAYLGGGAGSFHRQSVDDCQALTGSAGNYGCSDWLTQNRVSWLASGAVGMRFFTGPRGAVKIELSDSVFADSYRVNIDTASAEAGNASSGTPASSPGLIHLVMVDLGYSFIF